MVWITIGFENVNFLEKDWLWLLQIQYQHNSWERDLLSRMQDLRPDPRAWEMMGQQHISYRQYRKQSNIRFESIKKVNIINTVYTMLRYNERNEWNL